MRKEIIESKLAKITDSLNVIVENMPEEYEDFIKLGLIKEGLYKKVEFAIETILDICAVINSDLGLGMPEVEDDILDNLEKKRVLKKEVIAKIREMKGFRNLLVHKYGDVDDKKAFDNLKEGIEDFDIAMKDIENVLKRY